jgi:membrane fusion protein, multidrug efflux system
MALSHGRDRVIERQPVEEITQPRANSAPASGPAAANEAKEPEAREAREGGLAPQDRRPDGRDSPADKPERGDQTADGGGGGEAQNTSPRRRMIAIAFGAILGALAIAGGYLYWDYAGHFQSTDDAFIASRQFTVEPKVSGYITAVPVTDNQHVVAGDVIARIDDRDYRIALEQAEAQVASAQANIQNVDAQITVQQAQIIASQAQVEQAQATLVFAQQQAARYQDLSQRGAGSEQNAQQYNSSLRQQEAALRSTQAALVVAQRQVESLKAQRSVAEASLAQAKAQRDQALLNLSYTTVTAAESGRVVSLTAAVGVFAQAGTTLTMFVPDELWVTANFKETQLTEMRPGQPVSMRIDAYPDRVIRGQVASVQPGSGTAFSLLPAENATGNYVKVVQRVPVKLIIDTPPTDVALGPGMSVLPSVRVEPEASLYERLRSAIGRLRAHA